jgi:hypothetical protein
VLKTVYQAAKHNEKRDSAVSTATGYGLDGRWVGVRDFSLLHVVQARPGAHQPSDIMGTGIYFPERKADHSPPTNAEVKKAWIYSSTPPHAFAA